MSTAVLSEFQLNAFCDANILSFLPFEDQLRLGYDGAYDADEHSVEWAVLDRHIHVLAWLHERGVDCRSVIPESLVQYVDEPEVIDLAADVEVIRWAVRTYGESFTKHEYANKLWFGFAHLDDTRLFPKKEVQMVFNQLHALGIVSPFETLLRYAVQCRNVEMVKLLVSRYGNAICSRVDKFDSHPFVQLFADVCHLQNWTFYEYRERSFSFLESFMHYFTMSPELISFAIGSICDPNDTEGCTFTPTQTRALSIMNAAEYRLKRLPVWKPHEYADFYAQVRKLEMTAYDDDTLPPSYDDFLQEDVTLEDDEPWAWAWAWASAWFPRFL